MNEDEFEDGWPLAEQDILIIADLRSYLRRLVRKADHGDAVVGLGEAWAALDLIREQEPDINVGVSVSFRRGEYDYKEGLDYELRVCASGIELRLLQTSYSREVGSDHDCRILAYCDPQGGFAGDVAAWLSGAESILAEDDAQVSSSRDHL